METNQNNTLWRKIFISIQFFITLASIITFFVLIIHREQKAYIKKLHKEYCIKTIYKNKDQFDRYKLYSYLREDRTICIQMNYEIPTVLPCTNKIKKVIELNEKFRICVHKNKKMAEKS